MTRRSLSIPRDEHLDGTKIYDFAFTQPLTVAPGYSAVYSLNQIARGRNDDQRIGRQVTIKRLLLRYYTEAHNSDPTCPFVRVVVFRDSQFRGTIVTPTSVLQANSVESPPNKFNRDRFTILFDDTTTHSVTSSNGAIYEHLAPPLTQVVLDMDMVVNFTSNLGADIRGNNLAMIMPVKAGTNLTQITVYVRVFYTDD